MARVVVIGGGVIGCAIAERLSLERHQVTLLERDQLGCRASGAAAGELSPQSGSSQADAEALQSLAMFPELISRIEKDGAMNVEYQVQQGLRPAFTDEEAVELRATGERWLDASACRDAEPSLSHEALGAVLLEHAHLTPPRFVRALARAAANHDAEIHEGCPRRASTSRPMRCAA
jgi:glycine oxidase